MGEYQYPSIGVIFSAMQLPLPLQPGDLLRVIAPSGCLRSHTPGGRSEIDAYHQGIEIWQQQGYRVEIASGCEAQWGYLAGTDTQRRQQLRSAWCDPEVRGILCARGGYGGSRLLEEWHWQGGTPKWLIGFSDITALLWSLNQQEIVGIHGAVLTSLASEPDWSVRRLFDAVEGRPLSPLQGKGWGGGTVCGRLLPGNLTVATGLLGTAVQPSLQGIILALEDVGEAPYRIDRMLTQWRMMGALEGVIGIALGRFSSCDAHPSIPSFTVEEVLRDRLGDLNIPIVADLPFGHEGVNAALPVGIEVELDGDGGVLSVI
jgi:muramoyltetrapeptide carboxypeptidase